MKIASENIALCSEAGVRKGNEDRCAFRRSEDGSAALLVLADGMGGQACGEIASEWAVATVTKAFDKYGFDDPAGLLEDAIHGAHERIQKEAAADARKRGMGTTLVAAVLRDDWVLVGHVGDSRAFQFRLPNVRRLTQDHLYIMEVLGLDESKAKTHPKGHVLSQALGIPGDVHPSINRFDTEPGDWILICSDGIHGSLTEPEMCCILQSLDVTRATQAMVRQALANGSRDNCSVVAAVTGE